jgi:hypothetical protein
MVPPRVVGSAVTELPLFAREPSDDLRAAGASTLVPRTCGKCAGAEKSRESGVAVIPSVSVSLANERRTKECILDLFECMAFVEL